MGEGRFILDHLFLVVYYKNGRLSVTLLLQRRKRVTYDSNRIKLDFLESHNKYRRMHSAPELELDENLCVYAQERAEALAMANGLQNRKNPRYGENVMCLYSSNPHHVLSGQLPVDTWYEEKDDYTFGTEPTSLSTGHFTQIVWKNSKKVGVGWAKSKESIIYVVANYYPPGNRGGEFVNNVADIRGVVADGIIPSISAKPQQIDDTVTTAATDQLRPGTLTDITAVTDQPQRTDVINRADVADDQSQSAAVTDAAPITDQSQSATITDTAPVTDQSQSAVVTDTAPVTDRSQSVAVTDTTFVTDPPETTPTADTTSTAVTTAATGQSRPEVVTDTAAVVNKSQPTAVPNAAPVTVQPQPAPVTDAAFVTDQPEPTPIPDATFVTDQPEPKPTADTTPATEQPKPEATDDTKPIITSDKVTPGPKILSATALQVPKTPTKQRPKDVRDDVMASRNKADEMINVIKSVDQANPYSISRALKDLMKKAGQMVTAIGKIKTDTQHFKDVPPVDGFKQKAQELVRTLQTLKESSPKKREQKEADSLDEAQQGADELLSAAEKLREERVHVINIPDRLDEAKQTIEKVADTIGEIDANPEKAEKILDVVDDLKEGAGEFKEAVQVIEEEKEHATIIPEILDRARDTAKDVSDAIKKIKADGDYSQAAPGVADEAGEKLKEVAEEINKINQNQAVIALRKIAELKQIQNDFLLNCLGAHNRYREEHEVPLLKLNMELTKVSQAFAEELALSGLEKDFLKVNYGENLCYYNTDDPNSTLEGHECVDDWYGESEGYPFGIEPPNPEARSHFTQVVWKDSTDLGVGVFKSDNRITVVCLYMPPGNILGCFAENVPPVGGFTSSKDGYEEVDLSFTYIEDNFKGSLVKEVNKYRKRHGAAPVILDEGVSKDSQYLAEKMAEKNVFEHRTGSPYGTLTYGGRSTDAFFKATAKSAVDSWYKDSKSYDFTREPPNADCGNFTQLVWKRSRKIGIGYAKNKKSGYIYIVVDFSPPGNYKNEYMKNVSDVVDERVRQALKRGEAVEESETELQYVPSVRSVDKYAPMGDFTAFQVYSWNIHNEYRKLHGVPPLKLNKKICDFAKEWAEENLRLNKMVHRHNNKYGENIYAMFTSDTSRDPSPRVAAKTWYDEIVGYNFNNEDYDFSTLHFTQLIWRDSKEMGIDWVKNDRGNSYVVANYSPRGNVINRFRQNVPRPLSGPYAK